MHFFQLTINTQLLMSDYLTLRFFNVSLSLLERSKSSSLKHLNANDDADGIGLGSGSILLPAM